MIGFKEEKNEIRCSVITFQQALKGKRFNDYKWHCYHQFSITCFEDLSRNVKPLIRENKMVNADTILSRKQKALRNPNERCYWQWWKCER